MSAPSRPLCEVPCLICGRAMICVGWQLMQPVDGVTVTIPGNYGSAVYDPRTGNEHLLAIVCDHCLTERRDRVRVARVTRPEPTTLIREWTED